MIMRNGGRLAGAPLLLVREEPGRYAACGGAGRALAQAVPSGRSSP